MTSDRAEAIRRGDRRALARAITLVESTREDHNRQAEELVDQLLPDTGRSLRIGITGPPGVGKSTFIDAFGCHVLDEGQRLAVLAIDPSSTSIGGSILGDKTRMAELSTRGDVFIRPSPTGGALGGIGRRTRDAILLCEAAGYDLILVETVGVGQSETTVATVTDLFVLLVNPGGGDDLQGIKRGVMELADLLVVTKADGDLTHLAKRAAADYEMALHMTRPKRAAFTTEVLTCSAMTGTGISDVWSTLKTLGAELNSQGLITAGRREQAGHQLRNEIATALARRAESDPAFRKHRAAAERAAVEGETSVSTAARLVIDSYLG